VPATARSGTSADPYYGAPTTGDRAASRARDTDRSQAFAAGQAGEPFPWPNRDDSELADLYDSGRDTPADTPAPGAGPAGPRSSRGSTRPPQIPRRAKATANDAAGVLLGFLGYVLFLTYLRAGPGGVGQWFKAKFLNEVTP